MYIWIGSKSWEMYTPTLHLALGIGRQSLATLTLRGLPTVEAERTDTASKRDVDNKLTHAFR